MNEMLRIINGNFVSMCKGAKLPFQLIKFFSDNTGIEYKKIAVTTASNKIINMAVMFLPIKLLFVLSGAKNISVLVSIEDMLGRDLYLFVIFFILVSFYISNITLQIYRSRLVGRQKSNLKNDKYIFLTQPITYKSVNNTYMPFCQMIADMLIIFVVFASILFLSPLYAVLYLIVLVIFSLIYEQWVFSSHDTNLLNYLKIDKNVFIQIVSNIMLLIMFSGLVMLVLNTNMNVIMAVLLLLLVRLSIGSFRSYLSCHLKLRKFYQN